MSDHRCTSGLALRACKKKIEHIIEKNRSGCISTVGFQGNLFLFFLGGGEILIYIYLYLIYSLGTTSRRHIPTHGDIATGISVSSFPAGNSE